MDRVFHAGLVYQIIDVCIIYSGYYQVRYMEMIRRASAQLMYLP